FSPGLYNEARVCVCGPERRGGAAHRRCVGARVPRAPPVDYDPRVGDNIASRCFNLPSPYEVRLGLGFTVFGDRTGYLHNRMVNADGTCSVDATRGPKRIGRVSYNDPICPPSLPADYDEGVLVGTSGSSPICEWTSTKPLVSPNPCLRIVTPSGITVTMLVWQMQTPAFTAAIGPAARLIDGRIISGPVFGNSYAFTFQVQGGFAAASALGLLSLPATIRTLPGPPPANARWLYLVDSGDQVASSRVVLQGQLIRAEAHSLILDINTLVQ